MNVPKLLKKVQRKRLALKLYCLRLQHKAVSSLECLLQQGNYKELVLDLHYPGCPLEKHAAAAQAAGSDKRRYSDRHEGLHGALDNQNKGMTMDDG